MLALLQVILHPLPTPYQFRAGSQSCTRFRSLAESFSTARRIRRCISVSHSQHYVRSRSTSSNQSWSNSYSRNGRREISSSESRRTYS
jgi:hypothetical protein